MPSEQGFRHLFVVYSQFVGNGLSVWWSRIFTHDISDTHGYRINLFKPKRICDWTTYDEAFFDQACSKGCDDFFNIHGTLLRCHAEDWGDN